MSWTVKIDKAAKKELNKLNRSIQIEILRYLYKKLPLFEHPKQLGKPLTGELKGLWRYRVDQFRIICEIQENELVVLVLKIGHRSEVYE